MVETRYADTAEDNGSRSQGSQSFQKTDRDVWLQQHAVDPQKNDLIPQDLSRCVGAAENDASSSKRSQSKKKPRRAAAMRPTGRWSQRWRRV